MREQIYKLRDEALAAIATAPDVATLQEMRTRYLGKKADLSVLLGGLGKLSTIEERKEMGALGNEAKQAIGQALDEREAHLGQGELAKKLEAETLDVTLPGRPVGRGHLHIMQQVRTRIEEIFIAMGYEVAESREVETDWYNFEALNIPQGHPARDAQDSFFISDDVLLRTHTSNTQIRYMLEVAKGRTPVKIICPGRVFRRDFEDATHVSMFHQVEGLVIDKHITMAHLKGALTEMARGLFGPKAGIRLRPSYFPFTEPSAEMDVSCPFCQGNGCRVCKQSGWVEIGGSGMVHPNVLRAGGYDPEEVSGWAFGYGIERVAMLAYQIEDLRHFVTGDLRFLRQF
ncbi:MAG TPA: phenylalanine--tRNA ligase subunit alpha [Symbiobacteriaceae bacterium]|nr:phenylalanine--tRNA ligase subunit alpha [Symbiobacteriaceae bacterium]